MTRTFRHTMSALAALVLISASTTKPVSAQTTFEWLIMLSITETQQLRICINGVRQRFRFHDELITSMQISGPVGNVVLQNELRVPAGEFRCVAIPYTELVAAGLEPDPTTRAITFRVDILSPRGRAETVGANQARTIGAVMNIDAATGKVELYMPFGDFSDERFHVPQ